MSSTIDRSFASPSVCPVPVATNMSRSGIATTRSPENRLDPDRRGISRLKEGPLRTACPQVCHRLLAQGFGWHTDLGAVARPEQLIAPREVKRIGDVQTGEKRLHDRRIFWQKLYRLLSSSVQPLAPSSSQGPAEGSSLP